MSENNSVSRIGSCCFIRVGLVFLMLFFGITFFSSKSYADTEPLYLADDASYTNSQLVNRAPIYLQGHHLTVTDDFFNSAVIEFGNGGKLTVNGNMVTSKNVKCGTSGVLEVSGNYVQTDGFLYYGNNCTITISKDMRFTERGCPHYANEDTTSLMIGGDFLYDTSTGGGGLTCKTTIAGSITQTEESESIVFGDLTLNGNRKQNITLRQGSKIYKFASSNTDIENNGLLDGIKLQSDISVATTENSKFGYVSLEGHKLVINGDMSVFKDVVCGTNSTLEITGSYIQKDGFFYCGDKSTVTISKNMEFAEKGCPHYANEDTTSLRVGGDFIYGTSTGGGGLTCKTTIAGNVLQADSAPQIVFRNVTLLTPGSKVTLPNGLINTLIIMAGKSHYTFTNADCYQKLIATSEVTFDANGGEVDPSKTNVTTTQTYGELPIPVKKGSKFAGWIIDGTEIKVESDTVVEAVDDHTLTAIWEASDTVIMLRLYNPNSGEHFYTASEREKKALVKQGWNYEGVAWEGPSWSNTPVYRLYNESAGDHHYTTKAKERDNLVKAGWKDEGIGWYSDDAKSKPLYRLYNPNATTGSHHYTTSARERDQLVKIGWNDEGIGWYGYAQ